MTLAGGGSGNKTLFNLKPPITYGQPGDEKVVANFNFSEAGFGPLGSIALGPGGVFYTSTDTGLGYGTVFSVTPPANQGAAWQEQGWNRQGY